MTESTSVWTQLTAAHGAMDTCRICLDHGYEITAGAVYSGTQAAQIMVIGQAPGITESEVGRPFNAGSGTRLFQWLAEAGIEENWFRSTQYMTSITKCYPGKSSGGSGDRVPSRIEQDLCQPYLEAEIRLINPRLILPVGRLAINRFFPGTLPLSKLIGTKSRVGDRWIIPLPHPSGASRWHQIETNRRKIARAVRLISEILDNEGPWG